MIYIKRNKLLTILIFLSIIFFQYVQLKIVPLPSITRPISEIFIFILFYILFIQIPYIGKSKIQFISYYIKSKNIMKWKFLFFITLFYMLISMLISNQYVDSIKFLINILFAFLFYWYGYTRLGLSKEKFSKYNLIFAFPILLIGLLEVVGILAIPALHDVINSIRSNLVTQNFVKDRLHLIFSEPSFIGTYLLFLLYLISTNIYFKKFRLIIYFLITLFIFLGLSLNTIIIFGAFIVSYYLIYYKTNILIKLLLFSIITIGFIFIADLLFGNRLNNLNNDPSSFIRLTHINALIQMGMDSYGLGMGFGQYKEYFLNYLGTIDIPYRIAEFEGNLSGSEEPIPYSMFLSIFAYMGVLGIWAFLILFNKAFQKKSIHRHYYFALLMATISALPWGLPFIWTLLGLLDKDNEEQKIKEKNENITYS